MRFQGFVDRLDLGQPHRHTWRLRRQNDEIVESAAQFVDDHKWVPPVVDVARVVQTLATIATHDRPRELPEPRPSADRSADAHPA